MRLGEFMQRVAAGLEQAVRELEAFRRINGGLVLAILLLSAVLIFTSGGTSRRG